MTFGLNFGANNVTNAVNMATSILKTFRPGGSAFDSGIVLDFLEIGNEADLYGNNGLRPSNWTIDTYMEQ